MPLHQEDGCGAVIIVGILFLFCVFSAFFAPGLALYLTSEEEKYRTVTKIELIQNDTYLMGLQCLESNINEMIVSCVIKDFQSTVVTPCKKYSKSKYGLFQFRCTNETYLDERFSDQGGRYYSRDMAKYVVGILSMSLGGFIVVCVPSTVVIIVGLLIVYHLFTATL